MDELVEKEISRKCVPRIEPSEDNELSNGNSSKINENGNKNEDIMIE